METPEPFQKAIAVLEKNGIDYFVTGSLASMYWGKLRTTEDMDVVVSMSLRDAESLAASFPAPDYYVDRQAVVRAIETNQQFNVIHLPTAFKIDVIQIKQEPYAELQMSRRVRGSVMGTGAWIAPTWRAIRQRLADGAGPGLFD